MQTIRFLAIVLLASALPVTAQIPNTLLHPIPAPPVGFSTLSAFGTSVAVEGSYIVVGEPGHGAHALSAGAVKVFDSASGALLWLITNPNPVAQDGFGHSLALSGTRLVVGCPYDDDVASNSGSAYVFDLSRPDPRVPVFMMANPSPAVDDEYGGNVAISGTRVVVAAHLDDTGASNAGNAYVYDLTSGTPSLPALTLANPNPTSADQYGKSLAILGTVVAIGAWQDDAGGLNAGTVYLFDLAGGSPGLPAAELNNPRFSTGGGFGLALALNGTRLVVGSETYGAGGSNTGCAYVYELTGGMPGAPLVLDNPTPANEERFGSAVALSGNLLVVGAMGANYAFAGSREGAMYVYDLGGDTPTVAVAELSVPNLNTLDRFGAAVAVSGVQVVVGAEHDDVGASNNGSAHLFDLSIPAQPVPGPALIHVTPSLWDAFGSALAVSGDWLAVGAHVSAGGRVYVYDLGSGPPIIPLYTLSAPTPTDGANFGFAVALDGQKLVVGMPDDDTGAFSSGSAYVYDLGGLTPMVPVMRLHNPTTAMFDYHGRSVAVSGKWVIIGTYGDNTGADNAGSAYVYDMESATPTIPVWTLNNPTPASNESFGWAVAAYGNTVVVGTPFDTAGTFGRAYVYDLQGSTPTVPTITLSNPTPTGINFGWSVAIDGSGIVIGAYREDTGATDAGSAFVYDISSGQPTAPSFVLNNPAPAANDFFGQSVAISGTRVAVGVRQDDAGAMDSGSAYVFDLGSATPTQPTASLTNPSPNPSDQFGRAVAFHGANLIVGAPGESSVMYGKGYAYIYGPEPTVPDGDNDGLLDSWELTYWPTTTGHGPLDDEDKDGIVNLLELAFGLNPTQGNGSPLPPVVNDGGYLTLTLTKRPGVNYEVQSAASLLPALPESFSAASTTVLLDNTTTLKVRDNVLMSAPGGRFMRVKVTAAP